MLDKQENDRKNEMKSREARAQEFMNKMAGNVLEKMEKKQKEEDDMLMRYENERENRQRQLEERRAQRAKDEQERMRSFLSDQVKEKQARERADKENIGQQAQMWNLDKQNWELEEKRLKDKMSKIQMDNAAFLQRQMDEKHKKTNQNEQSKNRLVDQYLPNCTHALNKLVQSLAR